MISTHVHYYLQNGGWPSQGLCYCLRRVLQVGALSEKQEIRMHRQLIRKYGHLQRPTGYYWPVGQIAPRVRACLSLARYKELN